MKTSAIRALKPNVTQEEAVRFFRSGLFSAVYWKIRRGPQFPRVPADEDLVTIETRNQLVPRLHADAAEDLLRTKVLRVLFQQGFFKLRALRVEIERMPIEIHLPYWLAFYGSNGTAKCRVMDAVRRRIEGGKACSFFEEWLAA